jgi:hypothetical protein
MAKNRAQYYRPYELTKEQEDAIEDQIADAKAMIEREVELFNVRKEVHARKYGHSRPSTSRGESSNAEPVSRADSSAGHPHPTNNGSSARSGVDKDQHDEGDVVVEADEDMVIY